MNTKFNSMAGPIYPTNNYNNLVMNPIVLFIICFVIIMYYVLFSSLDSSPVTESSDSSNNLDIFLWAILIFLMFYNGMHYFSDINFDARLQNVLSDEPEIDIAINSDATSSVSDNDVLESSSIIKEVFNIPDNNYTYDDAKAICKAYGGRLAKYEEISEAYESGADWCNYGWSDDQMVLYPTQMDKWQQLQKIKGHEHDCGRPGINGGYIKNKNARFGANCYGYKPTITSEEQELMRSKDLYPKTNKDIEFDNKVNYWKTKISSILISPFNNKNWSMI